MHHFLKVCAIIQAALSIKVFAEVILKECLSKEPLVGTESGTNFSDEEQLTTSIDQSLRLYGYLECNDQNGFLKSFTVVLADQNKENRTKLSLIGHE